MRRATSRPTSSSTSSSRFPNVESLVGLGPALAKLVKRAAIRILDVVVLVKDDDGEVTLLELDVVDSMASLRELDDDVGGMLSDHDLELASLALEAGTTGVVIVTEDRWAKPLSISGPACRWPDHRRGPHPGFTSRIGTRREIRRPRERNVFMTTTKATRNHGQQPARPTALRGAGARRRLDGIRRRPGRAAQCARRPACSRPVVVRGVRASEGQGDRTVMPVTRLITVPRSRMESTSSSCVRVLRLVDRSARRALPSDRCAHRAPPRAYGTQACPAFDTSLDAPAEGRNSVPPTATTDRAIRWLRPPHASSPMATFAGAAAALARARRMSPYLLVSWRALAAASERE